MQFKSVFIILSGLFIFQSSLTLAPVYAAEQLKELREPPFETKNCIRSVSELKLKKDKFPAFLQKDPPVLFIRDSFPAVAALSFRIEGEKIRAEGVVKLPFGKKNEDGFVTKICFDEGELTAELEKDIGNGKKETEEYKVKVINDSTISSKGFEFRQATPIEYAQILNKINGVEQQSTAKTTSSNKSAKPAAPRAGKN